jgi:5-formyltetrahydrofolate cyclo-ligase
MAFASFGSEVPTDPILERLHREGHDLALPVVVGRRIEAVRFQSGDPMAVSALGLREPLSREFLDPSRIDVIVVPGVAFDRDGFRVGYGGGFYDRFLRRTGSSRIGICFSVQLVGEVPYGGTDVSVDALVTEAETLRFGARPQ